MIRWQNWWLRETIFYFGTFYSGFHDLRCLVFMYIFYAVDNVFFLYAVL